MKLYKSNFMWPPSGESMNYLAPWRKREKIIALEKKNITQRNFMILCIANLIFSEVFNCVMYEGTH